MSYSKKHLTEAISIINRIDSEKIENIVKIIKKEEFSFWELVVAQEIALMQ